jgi:hypothetical protein
LQVECWFTIKERALNHKKYDLRIFLTIYLRIITRF